MATLTPHSALTHAAFSRLALDRFLDPEYPTWAKHDPELGYRLSPVMVQDGLDGSRSIYSYEPNGARRLVNYRDRPCRLNTYGDSFTMCHQVSDGETWQEALAAHFGEPLRNFGVGGYGVYQAWLRLKRVESGADGAPYVILNLYDDDHIRNAMACRWVHTHWHGPYASDGVMFHSTPWAHVRLDPATGTWQEVANAFPDPQSLYRLCQPEAMIETYQHDPWLKLHLLCEGGEVDGVEDLHAIAECLGMSLDCSTPEVCQRTARALRLKYALESTRFVVELACSFCAERSKRLMFLLSYSSGNVIRALRGEPRFDQELVDCLHGTGLPVVDGLAAHVADYEAFRISPEDYCRRLFVGHYSPAGNLFFAYAIKPALVDWLEPKPVTYA